MLSLFKKMILSLWKLTRKKTKNNWKGYPLTCHLDEYKSYVETNTNYEHFTQRWIWNMISTYCNLHTLRLMLQLPAQVLQRHALFLFYGFPVSGDVQHSTHWLNYTAALVYVANHFPASSGFFCCFLVSQWSSMCIPLFPPPPPPPEISTKHLPSDQSYDVCPFTTR